MLSTAYPRTVPPSQGAGSSRETSRTRVAAYVASKSAICEVVGGCGRKRSSTRSREIRSEITARASASVSGTAASAARYRATEPPNRSRTIARSAASTVAGSTGSAARSTTRSRSALAAEPRSPVTAAVRATSLFRIRALPIVQRTPAGSEICPSSSDASNPVPAAAGPSHKFWSRVHRYTHAAAGLSGSAPGLRERRPPPRPDALHLRLRRHLLRSQRLELHEFEPGEASARGPGDRPGPGADWNCSSSATRLAGIPIWPKCATSPRSPLRIDRLARAGPSR